MNAARALASRLAPAALVSLGVALRLRALSIERIADDWYQRSMVEGTYPVHRAPWDLYDFIRATPAEHGALLDRGTFPWWMGADLHIAAWRPLASLTLTLDHALFGSGTVGPHAHSLAWLAALLAAAWWWMRAVLPRNYALVALALLSVSASLTVPTAWLANRPSLLSGVFGLLAMGVMARREVPSFKRDASVAALTFASVMSGEYGVAFAGCAVAYELVAGVGSPGSRARASLAVLASCGVYLATWKALGHGVEGTMTYLDPLSHPGAWLRAAALRFPALLGELVTTRPIALSLATPQAMWQTLVALASVVCVGVVVARRAASPLRRVALGLAAGMLAAMIPVLSAPPMERLLLAAAPAFAALVGALVACAWSPAAQGHRVLSKALAAVVVVGVAVQLVVPAIRSWQGLHSAAWWRVEDVAFRALPGVDACHTADQDHVLLAAGSFGVLHVIPLLWQGRGCVQPRTWRVLSVPPGASVALRADDRALTMFAPAGPLLGDVARLWHPDHFREGDTARALGFEATVVSVRDGAPTRVRYAFDRSLDDPRVVLWMSVAGGYEQVRAPPVNAGRLVPQPLGVPE
ncbi:MAG: hypothetical protein U0326_20795 [Polyangiales bacterium]